MTMGPSPAASRPAPNASTSPTRTIAAVIDVEVRPGRGGDGLRIDRLDPFPIADQLVDVELVDGQSGQGADDGAGGLEAEREHADQEVARGRELRGRDLGPAHPVELAEHVEDGRRR